MVYEMNDLKGILFLVLLKIITITSTNIDCSGNAFHCVNTTHFMICVDLGGGVSITIDDFIIPCPRGTVCERDNRFECEYPKIATTSYPLGVIGITKQDGTAIINDGLEAIVGYVQGIPESINPITTSTVTEEATTVTNVVILQKADLEPDPNVQSTTELTTVNYNNTSNTINEVNQVTANLKIQTNTHESLSSPNNKSFEAESVIETALDKPEKRNIDQAILRSNITINEINNITKIIYDSIPNERDYATIINNGTLTNKPTQNKQIPAEILYSSTVNKQQNYSNIQNNVHYINMDPHGLSGISNDNLANTTKQDPSMTWSDAHFTLNNNSIQNVTTFEQSAIFATIPSNITGANTVHEVKDQSDANKAQIVNGHVSEFISVNDFLTSQIPTETFFTEGVLVVDQVNKLPPEATNIQDIIVNTNLTESVNQTDQNNLNRKINEDPSTIKTEGYTLNNSGTQSVSNSIQNLPTTVIPFQTTNALKTEHHAPNESVLQIENNYETLFAKEIKTDNVLSMSEVSKLDSVGAIIIQYAVKTSITEEHRIGYTNDHTEVYETAKDSSPSFDVTTIDQFPTTITTESPTTNLSNPQNAINYNQSLLSAMQLTRILLKTNHSAIQHDNDNNATRSVLANNMNPVSATEFMTTTDISNTDIMLSNIKKNSLPAEAPYIRDVDNPINETDDNTKDNNITSRFTYNSIVFETATEEVPLINMSENFTSNTGSTQTVPTYGQDSTIATTTETLLLTDNLINETRTADDLITTVTFTDRILLPTKDPYIQDMRVEKKPNYDLLNQSDHNKVHTEVYPNVELLNMNKKIETITNHGLSTTSPTTDFNQILNNKTHQNIVNNELSLISTATNTPPTEMTSSIKEYQVSSETKIIKEDTTPENVVNKIKTTTEFYKDNVLFTKINMTSAEGIYYIQDDSLAIPVNQTNLNNLHDQLTTETSALITETLVYKTGTTESMNSPTYAESYNPSYNNIQQNITDRDRIVTISTLPVEAVVTTIIPDNIVTSTETTFIQVHPIITQVNQSERTNAQNKFYEAVSESNKLSWTSKNITSSNGTNTAVLSTNITDRHFDNINKIFAINKLNILPTHSTHITVRKTENNHTLLEELKTTEGLLTEEVIFTDKSYKESQVDINVKGILNKDSVTQKADTKEIQNFEDRLIQNNKDATSEINNKTFIPEIIITEGIPLTTTERVYRDLTGISSTQLANSNVLPTEKSITDIVSTTQNTLQSDNISVLSTTAEGSFMISSPIESITESANEPEIPLKTNNKFKTVQNITPTHPSEVVEILNTTTSSIPFDTYKNQFIVDHPEEIVMSTKVNTFETHTDSIIEFTTPRAYTASLSEDRLLDDKKEQTLVSTTTMLHSSTAINPSSESTSISLSTESNTNNTSAKNKRDFRINALDTTSNFVNSEYLNVGNIMATETTNLSGTDIIRTTENIVDFLTKLPASNIVTELPTIIKNIEVDPDITSLGELIVKNALRNSTFEMETITENTAKFSEDTFLPIAATIQPYLQLNSVLHDDIQNNTITNNNISHSDAPNLKVDSNNEANSNRATQTIRDTMNTPRASKHPITNGYNLTQNVFTGRENEPPVAIPRSTTKIPTLESSTQKTDIYSDQSRQYTSSPINSLNTSTGAPSTVISQNHETNTLNHKGNSADGNISGKTIANSFHFSCLNRSRGKYADDKDCRKFYICIGRPHPLAGTCPLNTVFSEINKQCTRNLSHCVRNNQFRCLLEGRFSDFFSDNIYYICNRNGPNNFIRYKLQCQSGFHLNKATVRCERSIDVSSVSASSVSENSQKSNDNSESKQNTKQNQEASNNGSSVCDKEGIFPYPEDCRKYYVCSKNSKSEYRRKIKQCSADEFFHSEKKKCMESESYVC